MTCCDFCGADALNGVQGKFADICPHCISLCVQLMTETVSDLQVRNNYLEDNNFKRHCHEGGDEKEMRSLTREEMKGPLKG